MPARLQLHLPFLIAIVLVAPVTAFGSENEWSMELALGSGAVSTTAYDGAFLYSDCCDAYLLLLRMSEGSSAPNFSGRAVWMPYTTPAFRVGGYIGLDALFSDVLVGKFKLAGRAAMRFGDFEPYLSLGLGYAAAKTSIGSVPRGRDTKSNYLIAPDGTRVPSGTLISADASALGAQVELGAAYYFDSFGITLEVGRSFYGALSEWEATANVASGEGKSTSVALGRLDDVPAAFLDGATVHLGVAWRF